MKTDYWYINNKAYDFSKFEHPGGPIAIELGRGRDATELFYSYHPLSSRAEAMLKKYEVVPALPMIDGHVPLFDWSTESKFFTELKSEVKKELGKNLTAPFVRWMQIVVMAVIALVSYYYFFKGHWWALIASPLSMWIVGVNTFHDASHFALSKDWRINVFFTYLFPWFSSPFSWYHQHIIGHHCYTNVHGLDPDLHHSARLWRYTRRSRFLKHYRWQCYYFVFVWMVVTVALSFFIDAFFFYKGSYHGIVKMMKISRTRFLRHIIGRIMAIGAYFVLPYFIFDSMFKAFLWTVVPSAIYGLCFSLSSQLSHLTATNIDQFSKDWYKHQVLTSHSFCPKSLFWFFFTGGLSLQIEHHLFPGVNHWHLRRIQPIVQRVSEKHGVNYTISHSMAEAFSRHMALLDELSKGPTKTN
jgi:fatty acid desaturase